MFGFTLDQQIGEFVLSHKNIKIPESGKIYSFNEGADSHSFWDRAAELDAAQLDGQGFKGSRERVPPHIFRAGNYAMWSEGLKKYMDSLKTGGKANDGEPYSARYIGSLVGDFHRTILYGGIYGYPGDKKNVNGKLRLLYECAPMSFIAEQAGGKGSDGKMRVLDINPEKVHQRVPLFVGSTKEVEYLESFMK